jgi:hypothetical protein
MSATHTDMLEVIIISLEAAFPTRVLAPHGALHTDTRVGQVKWLKCGFTATGMAAACREACRLDHRRETRSSKCRTLCDSWKISSLEMLGLAWRWGQALHARRVVEIASPALCMW